MRSFTFLVKGMAVAALVFTSVQCTDKKREAPVADKQTETVVSKELKLAFVRVDTLLSQYNLSKDLNELMLRKEENARATLNEKGKDLQRQLAEFQRKLQNNAFVSEERARQENDRLQKMQEDLQELQTRLASELDSEGKKNTQILHDSIQNFLRDYAKTHPYSMILSNAGLESLLYADPAYDITDEVVKGLNTRYKKASK
ncbi:MAG: OmpH family outer membrane protein [Bacteroidaceae bacterium]|jgi:outer membrane protein